jgi:hypothetical protein
MWLMLSAATDHPALWACQGLRARGLQPLEWISPEILAGARHWEHCFDRDHVGFGVTLAVAGGSTLLRCTGCSIGWCPYPTRCCGPPIRRTGTM